MTANKINSMNEASEKSEILPMDDAIIALDTCLQILDDKALSIDLKIAQLQNKEQRARIVLKEWWGRGRRERRMARYLRFLDSKNILRRDVAEELLISEPTIINWTSEGKVPSHEVDLIMQRFAVQSGLKESYVDSQKDDLIGYLYAIDQSRRHHRPEEFSNAEKSQSISKAINVAEFLILWKLSFAVNRKIAHQLLKEDSLLNIIAEANILSAEIGGKSFMSDPRISYDKKREAVRDLISIWGVPFCFVLTNLPRICWTTIK